MPYPPEIDFPGITCCRLAAQVACGAWFSQDGWGDFEGREAAWLANAMDISLEEQQEEGVLV